MFRMTREEAERSKSQIAILKNSRHSSVCISFASLVTLTLVMVLPGCASITRHDPVQVYVVGIEPLQGEGLELRMLVKLRVQNPNDTPIQYDGVYVDLNVQNRRFASGVSDAAGEVPRFGETVLSVPVSVSVFRLVRSAMGVFGEPTEKIEYELSGKLAGPVLKTVRFNAKGEMSLPKDVYDAAKDRDRLTEE